MSCTTECSAKDPNEGERSNALKAMYSRDLAWLNVWFNKLFPKYTEQSHKLDTNKYFSWLELSAVLSVALLWAVVSWGSYRVFSMSFRLSFRLSCLWMVFSQNEVQCWMKKQVRSTDKLESRTRNEMRILQNGPKYLWQMKILTSSNLLLASPEIFVHPACTWNLLIHGVTMLRFVLLTTVLDAS